MAIDGSYDCEVKTLLGTFPVKMVLTTLETDLQVSCCTQWGDRTVSGSLVSPDEFAFCGKVDSPLGELLLEVKAKVSGTNLAGKVKAGKFGTAPLKGKKV